MCLQYPVSRQRKVLTGAKASSGESSNYGQITMTRRAKIQKQTKKNPFKKRFTKVCTRQQLTFRNITLLTGLWIWLNTWSDLNSTVASKHSKSTKYLNYDCNFPRVVFSRAYTWLKTQYGQETNDSTGCRANLRGRSLRRERDLWRICVLSRGAL